MHLTKFSITDIIPQSRSKKGYRSWPSWMKQTTMPVPPPPKPTWQPAPQPTWQPAPQPTWQAPTPAPTTTPAAPPTTPPPGKRNILVDF